MQSPQNGCADRRDDAHLADAVAVPPALGDLAAVVRVGSGSSGISASIAATISAAGHDVVQPPAVRVADVHVLDEPQDQALVARPARQRQDRGLVHAAPDDRVDLDRREAGLPRGGDPVEHPRDREVDPVHRPNTSSSSESRLTVIRCSPASRAAAASARSAEPFVVSVRSSGAAVRPPERRQHRDQRRQVAPDQRLAAGDPELLDAERDERPRASRSISSNVSTSSRGQEREVAPEDLLRHAVRAAEVAAVGDRDPQVAQGRPKRSGMPGRPSKSVAVGRGSIGPS